MKYSEEIRNLTDYAKSINFEVELIDKGTSVCRVVPKKAIVSKEYGEWQTVIILAHELGHAEQFKLELKDGIFKNLNGCKRHYRGIKGNVKRNIIYELDAWFRAYHILSRLGIKKHKFFKMAAYSLDAKISKHKNGYKESNMLVIKTVFKIIPFYVWNLVENFKRYQVMNPFKLNYYKL